MSVSYIYFRVFEKSHIFPGPRTFYGKHCIMLLTKFKCITGMAGMFWPLCAQGTDTEESGVRGGGGGRGMLLLNREKIDAEKNEPFIH